MSQTPPPMPPPPPPPPPGGYGPPPGPMGAQVPNYLVQSILVTLFCCLIGGIVAIVYSSQVNSKLQAGDVAGAMEASKNAKMWVWLSFGIGLAVNVVFGIIYLAAIASTSST